MKELELALPVVKRVNASAPEASIAKRKAVVVANRVFNTMTV